jgi:hypothetical protein
MILFVGKFAKGNDVIKAFIPLGARLAANGVEKSSEGEGAKPWPL